MYQTLSKSIRAGDYSKFKQVIDSNYHYLKDKNLLLLMNGNTYIKKFDQESLDRA